MNQQDIDALFDKNMEELNHMNVASGSMIKAFLQGLEENGPVYLRLSNAVREGHSVNYTLVSGDALIVKNVADLLGLKLNGSVIEVNHA